MIVEELIKKKDEKHKQYNNLITNPIEFSFGTVRGRKY
jgi:hypothetical protein